MTALVTSTFLRRALAADAAASGAMGVLLGLGAEPLAGLLGLAPDHTRPAGVLLVAYAGFVGWLASRPGLSRPMIWTVIIGNLVYAAASIGLLPLGVIQPTAVGMAFVIGQAVVVALLADLQFVGLRRAVPA